MTTTATSLCVDNVWTMIACRKTSGVYTIRSGKVGTDSALVDRAWTAITTDSGWGVNSFNLGTSWVGGGSAYSFGGRIDLAGGRPDSLSTTDLDTLYAAGVGLDPFA